jgi:hypothetical protein
MNEEIREVEVIQTHSLELMQRAEIDQQITTAKRYPRDLARVKRRMMDFATLDEETAAACFYTLVREGKTIPGPSVRLAEIAVACYGNIRAASRIIDNDGKAITCQGVCHDLENNTLISVEIKRRITKRDGSTYNDDMQVVAGNAGNAIAFRNAVFKVVPGALIKPVYEACRKVAVGDASTLLTRRRKVLDRLAAMEVTAEKVLRKLGKSNIENIGLEDLEILVGLGTAIRDGDTTVDEAFAPEKETMKAAISIDQIKASADPNRGHDQTQAPPEPQPLDESPEAVERRKQEAAKLEEEIKTRAARKCGTCGLAGHDSRNCPNKDKAAAPAGPKQMPLTQSVLGGQIAPAQEPHPDLQTSAIVKEVTELPDPLNTFLPAVKMGEKYYQKNRDQSAWLICSREVAEELCR